MSSTATFTPLPVCPARHAVGAPICAVERSRLGRRTPSNHTLRTLALDTSVRQVSPASDLTTCAAYEPTAGSGWPTRRPAVAGSCSPVTISGTVSRPRSS
ncbi:hypothetical protein [Saccharothrix texasensis]|uniref:Uncharacterized protein n=1 Tax=Saccharothrix texasensis TaxID=103734 RepID=A0A3N1H4M0_9PSEU|nr:hypothetical protein [Saccharothrix texasensis]ROP37470.1 hypothetical protein EDD40_2783 [Saccharothrix texasensis]